LSFSKMAELIEQRQSIGYFAGPRSRQTG
jgi:hypothetical protein